MAALCPDNGDLPRGGTPELQVEADCARLNTPEPEKDQHFSEGCARPPCAAQSRGVVSYRLP
eukprot:1162090-Pelagomonas_calceolata.AAC.17